MMMQTKVQLQRRCRPAVAATMGAAAPCSLSAKTPKTRLAMVAAHCFTTALCRTLQTRHLVAYWLDSRSACRRIWCGQAGTRSPFPTYLRHLQALRKRLLPARTRLCVVDLHKRQPRLGVAGAVRQSPLRLLPLLLQLTLWTPPLLRRPLPLAPHLSRVYHLMRH